VADLLYIAKEHGIMLCACCVLPGLYGLGVQLVSCVDASLFGASAPRDKNQREGCNCSVSVDIGAYNSCVYCYANHSAASVAANMRRHDSAGEFLLGETL